MREDEQNKCQAHRSKRIDARKSGLDRRGSRDARQKLVFCGGISRLEELKALRRLVELVHQGRMTNRSRPQCLHAIAESLTCSAQYGQFIGSNPPQNLSPKRSCFERMARCHLIEKNNTNQQQALHASFEVRDVVAW